MAEKLAAAPGSTGLITANGGYLTKHAFGVYSAAPPPNGFRWADVQDVVDREPTRRAIADFDGVGTVETWTALYDRDGVAETVILAVRPRIRRSMAS